jgi:predicted glycosyltransferase
MEASGGYAGELSHCADIKGKIIYIGILSRFNNYKFSEVESNLIQKRRILILISGPENQRSVFEKIIMDQLNTISDKYKCIIVRGLPAEKTNLDPGWYNHMPSKELMNSINKADAIICRSGYSTIMDLLTLNKTALLVPTPGQVEQEYLAEYLSSKKLFCTMKQDEFEIGLAIEKLLSVKR